MKVCVTAKGEFLQSRFEKHFARAPWFLFYDTETGAVEAVKNGFVISNARIGQNAVRLLKMNGLEAVITGKVGDSARDLLTGADIAIHLYDGKGTVKDALMALGMAKEA